MFKSFSNWLKTNHVSFEDKIRFGLNVGEEGNGLVAAKDLNEGELLVQIPKEMILSIKTARESESPIKEILNKDNMLKSSPSLALALYLLYEKENPHSFWEPYIRILPKTFSIPLHWNLDQLSNLQGSTQKEALKLIKNTVKQYTYLYTVLKRKSLEVEGFSLNKFTFEKFLWAISVVMTRQNSIPGDNGEFQLALIPLWDMSNHDEGKITTFFEEKGANCSAMRSFKKGEQIRIFYGPRPNSQLLNYSGFVFKENLHDSVKLLIILSKEDPLYSEKFKLFNADLLEVELLKSEGLNSVLPVFRLLSMNKQQLDNVTEENLAEVCSKEVSPENEESAKKNAVKFLEETLQLYPTTILEDRALLPSIQRDERKRLAVLARLLEKELIAEAAGTNPQSQAPKVETTPTNQQQSSGSASKSRRKKKN
eukprot:TRINITY_DN3313_c0_g1_i4.p1 TRINITY_DN3313_c0_g1~~TRINITY_DN3313_c0_g1_i4.p1  ORF type:complete len:424 (+),score=156.75 TRINITY_DN3313_c0_g1_i4:339-1610(+)